MVLRRAQNFGRLDGHASAERLINRIQEEVEIGD
jgi:hypothetical protein